MLQLPRLIRRVVSQDVALRNAASATAGLRERRRMNEDVEAFLNRRAKEHLVALRRTGN